jgi:HAD domain in Swiss Army Knife RNA repair proteins
MTPLRGSGGRLLYLDFDGVLHPEDVVWRRDHGIYIRSPPGHVLFENAPLLERLLLPVIDVQIVLSTSWVRAFGYSGAVRRLPRPCSDA